MNSPSLGISKDQQRLSDDDGRRAYLVSRSFWMSEDNKNMIAVLVMKVNLRFISIGRCHITVCWWGPKARSRKSGRGWGSITDTWNERAVKTWSAIGRGFWSRLTVKESSLPMISRDVGFGGSRNRSSRPFCLRTRFRRAWYRCLGWWSTWLPKSERRMSWEGLTGLCLLQASLTPGIENVHPNRIRSYCIPLG